MLKVYVTNLGKYNEGELVGKWLEFPCCEYDISEVLEEIGIGEDYEEYFLTDWEGEFADLLDIDEYTNLYTICENIEKLENLSDTEINLLKGYVEIQGLSTIDDILEAIDGCYIIDDISNEGDLAYYMVHEAGIYSTENLGFLANYIDYNSLGRDMMYDGYHLIGDDKAIYIPL